MQMDAYVQALRDDLAAIAALGDETTARAAGLLSTALEAALGRRLQEALAEAALELSAQMEHGRVEVRMAGSDPELIYVDDEEAGAPGDLGDEALSARITLRLPENLKTRLEAAAAGRGVSVNTWLVQALSRELTPRSSTGSRRLTGYGRS